MTSVTVTEREGTPSPVPGSDQPGGSGEKVTEIAQSVVQQEQRGRQSPPLTDRTNSPPPTTLPPASAPPTDVVEEQQSQQQQEPVQEQQPQPVMMTKKQRCARGCGDLWSVTVECAVIAGAKLRDWGYVIAGSCKRHCCKGKVEGKKA